jgi:hypothetical protein
MLADPATLRITQAQITSAATTQAAPPARVESRAHEPNQPPPNPGLLQGPTNGRYRVQKERDAHVLKTHPSTVTNSFEEIRQRDARVPVVANCGSGLKHAWEAILATQGRIKDPSRLLSDLAHLQLIHREAQKLPDARRAKHLSRVRLSTPPPRLIETKLPLREVVRVLASGEKTLVVTDEWTLFSPVFSSPSGKDRDCRKRRVLPASKARHRGSSCRMRPAT